jgi:hypothetical protein
VPIEGSLKFILPMSYFPKLQAEPGEYEKPITFHFSAQILSYDPIEEISLPENFECKPGTKHETPEPEDSDSSFSSFNGGDLSFRSDSSNESFTLADAPQHNAQPEQNCNFMIRNLGKKLQDIKNNIFISFRTSKMDSFKLLYQESEDHPGEVAVMAQFMPTFESEERE